jgi:hypothetical protein
LACPIAACPAVRVPWDDATFQPAGNGVPRLLRAQFGSQLANLQVIGTHLAYPLQPELQARNAEWITTYASELTGPVWSPAIST